MKKAIFGVIVFLTLCATCAEIGRQLKEQSVERQQRIKLQKENYIEEIRRECRLRHPLDHMGQVLCYDDLLGLMRFV